ncbi:Rhodanese-like protein [Westerdykella ornata]|uniref:Rhodanese-like protein n=1 Tax=Westerdykella ornata TaxID=318751 RepID=A0A6A6JSX7_WESOR|nr:Rhodanese-like protein [Westerdykella ornata]KAF2279213.1 Rhodanese-like protein [Westerdykella ornata]
MAMKPALRPLVRRSSCLSVQARAISQCTAMSVSARWLTGLKATRSSYTRASASVLCHDCAKWGNPRIPARRWYANPGVEESAEGKPSTLYAFEDIQSLSTHPSPSRILIDVREPSELQSTGTIPTALNIPITSQPDALLLGPEDFEDRFGFPKPGTDKEVVFFCKAGVRSRAAAQIAKRAGYDKVGEYPGSWLDWAKNGGEAAKV